MKHEMIAMILAGGQGTRLGPLTKHIAKPAVSFGGKYRMIDFALSNCANSGIDHVGIVTQYQPLDLNAHIANGEAWGLDTRGGATILQPYSSSEGEKWFEGTAHAIYQNMAYIDRLDPEYLLILSGDHIYKMNYETMLAQHKAKKADLTVAVKPVPLEEASRFGIMTTDDQGRITAFEEKPDVPQSNLASMGIYIFTWSILREYLLKGSKLDDFGKDVIPAFLKAGQACYTYSFEGYWKDVGTIQSLWQANMEMLNQDHPIFKEENEWRIYTNAPISPAQVITNHAAIYNSYVNDGCYVSGEIHDSILSQDVVIGLDSQVKGAVLMANAQIGASCRVEYAILGENAVVEDGGMVIGTKDQIAVVGANERVGGY